MLISSLADTCLTRRRLMRRSRNRGLKACRCQVARRALGKAGTARPDRRPHQGALLGEGEIDGCSPLRRASSE